MPLLVISPWAKQNFVDSTLTEQTSIIKFIEGNWALPALPAPSFDQRSASLTQMFDFNVGDARAPKLMLNEQTGLPPGGRIVPNPTPTPTPTATPTPTPPKPVLHKPNVKLSCKASGTGKKLTIACTASGSDATKKTALRLRIYKGKKLVANVASKLSHKKAKVVIKPKKALKKGKYSLRITITQANSTVVVKNFTIRVK